MSHLSYNSTPAERFIDCSFAEGFKNALAVVQNGGTISGNPVIYNGITLDGSSDYVQYALIGSEAWTTKYSFVIEFWPDFAYDADQNYYFFGLDDGAGTSPQYLRKANNAGSNVIRLALRSGATIDVPSATYSPYWLTGQRNIIVFSGESGNNNMWLNGTQIVTNDSTSWNIAQDTKDHLTIGASYAQTLLFDGKIVSFKLFRSLLTAEDAINYYNKTNYTWRDNLLLDLPMTADRHDPTNVRALNVSGNAKHAQLGDGSTSSTYPTKLSRRGYNFDGGDYLEIDDAIIDANSDFSICMWCRMDEGTSGNCALFSKRDAADDGVYLFYDYSNARFQANYNSVNFTYSTNVKDFALVLTFDVSGYMRLYINGIEVGSADISGQTITLTSAKVFVGALADSDSPTTYMQGDLYSFRIMDYIMSPIQIADHYIQMINEINRI